MTEQENWTVKAVDGVEQKTTQEKEKEVLEVAAEVGDIPAEAVPDADDTIKVEEVVEEVKEEEVTEVVEEPVAEPEPEEESVIELIEEAPADIKVEAPPTVTPEQKQEAQLELPENVDKLVKFMTDTGGTVEDFISLNKDISKLDDVDVLKEYYRKKHPHWDEGRISRDMDKKFLFDEDADEPENIQDKKYLFSDELSDARKYLSEQKDKYYADLKLRPKQNVEPKYQEAFEYYNNQKEQETAHEKLVEQFKQSTDTLFNEEFKGFDFKVKESKYRYKVAEPQKVKSNQMDLGNIVGKYLNEDGTLKDAGGYHKAMFAAENADKIAQHFYEQGRADAIKQSAKSAKNIDMDPRSDSGAVQSPKTTWRVVNPENPGEFKVKPRK